MGADIGKLSPRHDGRSKYHDKLPNGKDVSEIMKEYRNAVPKQELNPVPKVDKKGEQLLKMRAEEIRIERENKLKEIEAKQVENGVDNNNSNTKDRRKKASRTESRNKESDLENRNSLKKDRRRDRSPEKGKHSGSKSRKERNKDDLDPEKTRGHKQPRDNDRSRDRAKTDEARKVTRKDDRDTNKDRQKSRKGKSADADGKSKVRNKLDENGTKNSKTKEERRRHRSRTEEEGALKRENSGNGEKKDRKESRSRDRREKSRSNSARSSQRKPQEKEVGTEDEKGGKERGRSHRDDVNGDVTSRGTKSRRDRSSKDSEMKNDAEPSKKTSKNHEKSPTRKSNKKSRKKNKSKLKEKKAIHRSAPDLTDVNNSKVGAWLNSAPAWHPGTSPPPWGYPMPMMNFGSLPRDGGRVHEVPRNVVDGMGNPVAQVYPVDPNVSMIMSPPYDMSAQFHSMHPYFTMPYPYMYPMQNVYTQAENGEKRTHVRSRSSENIQSTSNQNSKKANVNGVPVSPGNSHQTPFFSDIVETQNFISDAIKFQASRTFSVDDVTMAKFDDKLEPSSSNSSDSTSSRSSLNDVTIDLEEVERFKVKSAAQKSRNESAMAPTNDVKIFQPKSNREVFIDSTPKRELKSMTSLSMSQKSTLTSTTENSFKVPSLKSDKTDPVKPATSKPSTIMTLCDSESIVATSFMAEGGKFFCIKRSKSESNPKEIKRKISAVGDHETSPQPVKNPEPEGMWFGITASPLSAKNQPIRPRGNQGEASTNHVAEIKPIVQPTNRNASNHVTEPRIESRDKPIQHVSPPMPKSIENLFKYPQNETKFIDNYRAASMLAKSPSKPVRQSDSNQQKPVTKPELVKPVKTTSPYKQNPFPVKTFNSVSQPNYKPETPSSSESDDSEVFEARYGDKSPSLAKKLVRIDSHDSFTMKRRFKHLRKQSSVSGPPSGRRATIGSISQSDYNQIQSPSTPDLRQSLDSTLNPFKSPQTPGIESYLYRAKSEEALKYSMSKSTEELLNEAPAARKETLQERAARILGLSNDDLNKAKQNKTETVTNVTPSKAAMGNISHTSESPRLQSRTVPKPTDSESFAVSVTDSMIAKLPDNVTVKVLDTDSSGDNVSSISNDDRSSISDQCLSNTTTEASLKEYQLPTDFLNQSTSSGTSVNSPRLGQEGIVASYATSIYDKLPPESLRHSREYSDDTTESESVQSPTRKELQSQDFTQADHSRILESPVPIASYSAPLTSGELDIIMQLYNSADESPGTSHGREPNNFRPKTHTPINSAQDKNQLRKQQIAQAIGLDFNNIGKGELPKSNLEKVEDFNIKVFPGAREFSGDASRLAPEPGKPRGAMKEPGTGEDGVYEVMQSLGLDPDESWLVSL